MIFRNVPQQLKDAGNDGNLIIFIGAGVTRTRGWNSWWEYARAKLEYLRNKKYITDKECSSIIDMKDISPRQILSICDVILKENKDIINDEKQFLLTKEETENNIYENLYRLNAVYVTTNYDNCLDELAGKDKVFYSNDEFLESKLFVPGNILHIHGGMKADQSPVITLWDYIKRYRYKSNLSNLLNVMFQKYHVLFIGYGLSEYEILEYVVNIAERESGNELRHFLLYPLRDDEKEVEHLYEKYYYQLGIQLLSYEIGPLKNYNILEDITKQLLDEITIRSPYVMKKLEILEGVDL